MQSLSQMENVENAIPSRYQDKIYKISSILKNDKTQIIVYKMRQKGHFLTPPWAPFLISRSIVQSNALLLDY